jgi:ABC-type lipoprotein export system ATPase subunit
MLSVTGVAKRFEATEILKGVDLHIRAGESVALIGESGSGKSTLLNIIAGLEVFDSGAVQVAGVDLAEATSAQKSELRATKLGFVFQAFHLMPHLSALQNIMLPILLLRKPEAQAKVAAHGLLEKLGLTQRANAMPNKLSGGEQQRVALARAIIHQPSLVLADEPTGNLDANNADLALQLLLETVKHSGAALLIVTHSERVASRADRAVRLQNGKLIALNV